MGWQLALKRKGLYPFSRMAERIEDLETATAGLNAAELGVLNGVTPGTVTASKALVVDSSKDLADLRNLSATNVKAGKSGAAGTVEVFPATASKGKLQVTQADNAGDTTNLIAVAAQAGARTIGLPDFSTKAGADTEGSLAVIKIVADTTNRPGAVGCLLFATGNSKLYVCTVASATAATWTVVGTQS